MMTGDPIHDIGTDADEYPAQNALVGVQDEAVQAVTTRSRRGTGTGIGSGGFPRSVQDVLAEHLRKTGQTARAFAETAGVSYPSVLAALNKGSLPRRGEHREALRQALGVETDVWAAMIAGSGREAIDLGGTAPTFQQLILKAILMGGETEQSFADRTGIPYPTILGVTRKGAIPRGETIAMIGGALGFDAADIDAALDRSRAVRKEGTPPVPDPTTQNLAQLVANTARRNGQSLAAFARVHDLPYLAIMRLVGSGSIPEGDETLGNLSRALGLDDETFDDLVSRMRSNPEPAGSDDGDQTTPLQAALRQVIEQKGLTMKAFAELSELSVLTATRLVKHGALPSRTTTHAKLRNLLGLPEGEYNELLARSKQTQATDVIDEEFQHRETEEITPVGEDGTPLAVKVLTDVDPELSKMIASLDHKKRQALKTFIKTLL